MSSTSPEKGTANPPAGFLPFAEKERIACMLEVLPWLVKENSAYHVGWVVLQYLGLISGLSSERGQIVADLRELAAERPVASVLIAGAADFGLLSVLHEAFGAQLCGMRILVADRCATPLSVCGRYSARMGLRIETGETELAALQGGGGFDLVLTHSLLSFVPFDQRPVVVRQLAAILAPGGSLMLYQSIRKQHGEPRLRYSADETATLVAAARAAYSRQKVDSGWLPEQGVQSVVEAFCAAKQTWVVSSGMELVRLIEQAGLELWMAHRMFDSSNLSHRPATTQSAYAKYCFVGRRPMPAS